MKIEKYTLENMMQMDSMHDCIVKEIKIEEDYLVVKYENLINQINNPDGTPCYKYNNLTSKYKFDLELGVVIVSYNGKRQHIEFPEIYNYLNDYDIQSYKYLLDSFNEITLYFNLSKKTEKFKSKDYYSLEVTFYTKDITYFWE